MSNFLNVRDSSSSKVLYLKDVKVPDKFFNRIKSDNGVLDQIFGGQDTPGILPGSCTLFTGAPGAGKSTVSLELAEMFVKNGHEPLYNIGEENEVMIKLAAERLKLGGNFRISKFEDVNELISYCTKNKVQVLFQDSLQSLSDGALFGNTKTKSIIEKLQSHSKNTDQATFVIGHVTKSGTYSGPGKIKHDVDVHIHLSLDPQTGKRVFQLEKNRFGPALIPYEFSLTAGGVKFEASIDNSDENASVARSNKQLEARDVVRDLLLDGRKLSGYSYEEEAELIVLNISGGFMRAILKSVCDELTSEGYKVCSETINRREHRYLEKGRKL